MIKNCTSLNQSRKLLGFNIDPDTADMSWTNMSRGDFNTDGKFRLNAKTVREIRQFYDKEYPCSDGTW